MNKCCKNCALWKSDCTGFVVLDDFCDDYQPFEANDQEVQQILDDAADLGMKMIAMAFGVPASSIMPAQAQQNAGRADQARPAPQKETYR